MSKSVDTKSFELDATLQQLLLESDLFNQSAFEQVPNFIPSTPGEELSPKLSLLLLSALKHQTKSAHSGGAELTAKSKAIESQLQRLSFTTNPKSKTLETLRTVIDLALENGLDTSAKFQNFLSNTTVDGKSLAEVEILSDLKSTDKSTQAKGRHFLNLLS